MRVTITKCNGCDIILGWNFYGFNRRWYWYVIHQATGKVKLQGWSIAGKSRYEIMHSLKASCIDN